MPPSLPTSTWCELAGLTHMWWWSTWVCGAICVWIVRPPSSVWCSPTPPRYTISGSFGSIVTWLKYIGRGFVLFTLRHVSPPSSER
jgi:hypothetical protein